MYRRLISISQSDAAVLAHYYAYNMHRSPAVCKLGHDVGHGTKRAKIVC